MFLFDLLVNLNTGFFVQFKSQKTLVMQRWRICMYYLLHDTLIVDALATVADLYKARAAWMTCGHGRLMGGVDVVDEQMHSLCCWRLARAPRAPQPLQIRCCPSCDWGVCGGSRACGAKSGRMWYVACLYIGTYQYPSGT